jgi:ceramide glucosyltransferase
MSVFKPLPPLGARGLQAEATGVESFIAQLDDDAELLLGIHEADRAITASFVERMRQRYPKARIKVIYRSKLDDMANPKIAWQKILAPQALGDLWLWSDAEIIAPAGFLHSARLDYERSGATMMTFPYAVRAIPSSRALLDALFINVEFYPGVLLLRKLGPVDFGLGAAMLFARSEFESRVDCKELGSSLADDFVLGQKLKPVRVGRMTLTTQVDEASWKQAILHNLRWNKTVRWNRPVGFATRILVQPVLGWLVYLTLHPAQPVAWAGFLGTIELEVIFAAIICQRLGCKIKARDVLLMQLWSLWRLLAWIGCWFPWPVNWRGQLWWGPRWT